MCVLWRMLGLFFPGVVEGRDLHLLRGGRGDTSWLVYVWVWTHFLCVCLTIWLKEVVLKRGCAL
jgi:hypothetical protein